jgi:hypothetical protein
MDLVRVHPQVDTLDDLGAVLECDVQILQLEQCQLVTPFLTEESGSTAPLVTPS